MPELMQWNLTPRQICDLELLSNSGFAPLTGFLTQKDYQSVLDNMRLSTGEVWPMPITLDVSQQFADSIDLNTEIELRDQEGVVLATMIVEDKWVPNKKEEAEKVFGTTDLAHPAVRYLMEQSGEVYLGGKITPKQLPSHYDFTHIRRTPAELKAYFKENGWDKVVAFQTRNPMHRAHQQLTINAANDLGAHVLIHPVVGMTKPGDIDYFTRVRCYEKLIKRYPEDSAMLSLLPLAMRMAGPREALWHALIRKNYGCTHFIVGRDHAGPGNDSNGQLFYGPYDAQDIVAKYQDEIGIEMVPFKEMVYVKDTKTYQPADSVTDPEQIARISGTEFRRRLRADEEIPEWFSFPEVIEELKRTIPPKEKQGFTVFFTGLSGAGKSTIAKALISRLLEYGGRSVTLLDGDLVRKHLSSELGFSKEHRDLNITRIGYVASEITKHRGIAVCAPIAPYRHTRRQVRDMVSEYGTFVEVHVSTPLVECERRDVKGLYKKARAGEIKGFTGIDDPYEAPEHAELVLDTTGQTVASQVDKVMGYLFGQGYLLTETTAMGDKNETAADTKKARNTLSQPSEVA
ncbi:MAG: bifunctional sulfate adenylyltransferase/adenylylsulfate kinase [Coxiellaceae bacterium]|nr:bifunctional sulfate adenylyltransferase/adenylylsulfate kinase [Coxiellaceae bacterium]